MPTQREGDYSAFAIAFLVPGGEALWLASNSCSVMGRVMGHGLLVEVSVTGGHELVAVAALVIMRPDWACDWKSLAAVARHTLSMAVASGCGPPP